MTITRLPFDAADTITRMGLSPMMVLLILLVVFVIAGCLMDALAFLLIALPIIKPLLLDNGAFDPIWLGVLLCLVTTLGAITPPVGICSFIVASMNKDIPMEKVFRGAMYFIPAYVLVGIIMMLDHGWTVQILSNLVR
jgi:TRAP-type C4-dicarboxylate transport system permease large subunit